MNHKGWYVIKLNQPVLKNIWKKNALLFRCYFKNLFGFYLSSGRYLFDLIRENW